MMMQQWKNAFTICRREFLSHVRSYRFIVSTVIMVVLTLTMTLFGFNLSPRSARSRHLYEFGVGAVIQVYSAVMAYFGSPLALTMTFDTIVGEKEKGSLDLLLYRPTSRGAIVLRKTLGSLLVLIIPLSLVIVIADVSISVVLGVSLEAPLVINFLVLSILMLAAYAFIGQTISTLSKSSVGSILLCVFVWFLTMFLLPSLVWQHLSPFLSQKMGLSPTEGKNLNFVIQSAASPCQAYALAFLVAIDDSTVRHAIEAGGLYVWAPHLSLIGYSIFFFLLSWLALKLRY